MSDKHYHVRSKITHARVVIDVPRDVAESECKRLNREAETGVRAAYGEGDDHVPQQRLVAENTGQALADAGLMHPSLVGRIQQAGEAMEYEVEVEKRA